MAELYQMVSENPESTIVAEFEPGYRTAAQYQSEAEMEDDFIRQLERQAYERVKQEPMEFSCSLLSVLSITFRVQNYTLRELTSMN